MKRVDGMQALGGLADEFILEAAEYGKAAERKKAPAERRLRAAAIAAAVCVLVFSLGATAMAARFAAFSAEGGMSLTDFFDNAFGSGVPGRDASDSIVTDEEGRVVKAEHYPAVQRVEADAGQIEALLGADVMAVNQGVSIGGYTVIVRNMVVDETGIGVLTCEVENPDGLNMADNGNPQDADLPRRIGLVLYTAQGEMMDEETYASAEHFAEDRAVFVMYFTPFYAFDSEALALKVIRYGGEDGRWEEAVLELPVERSVRTRAMESGRYDIRISPMGMSIRAEEWDVRNVGLERLVIGYEDGSEYVVIGEDMYNVAVSSVCGDGIALAFNRFVDVERIADIEVRLDGEP